jgi:hypothetical protein
MIPSFIVEQIKLNQIFYVSSWKKDIRSKDSNTFFFTFSFVCNFYIIKHIWETFTNFLNIFATNL